MKVLICSFGGLGFCPLEKKARLGPFLRSNNSSLKPEWIKRSPKPRREREKLDNKKDTS